MFSKTEMSEVLTEVVRMDPTFDKEEFIKLCRFDIIPNILEVYMLFLCCVEFNVDWLPFYSVHW